jgi:hypothetical protein
MIRELFWVLVQEPVAGIWVDAQLGVGQVMGKQVAVLSSLICDLPGESGQNGGMPARAH